MYHLVSLKPSQLWLIVPKSHFLASAHGWMWMAQWHQFQTATSQMSMAIWMQSWKGGCDEFGAANMNEERSNLSQAARESGAQMRTNG